MAQVELLLRDETDYYRHWHVGSEKYAGGDSLATLLLLGWQLKPVAFEDIFYCSGSRPVHIYHFELLREGETVAMSVLGNPYVSRLVSERALRIVPVDRSRAPSIALSRFLKRAALDAQELETTEAETVKIRV